MNSLPENIDKLRYEREKQARKEAERLLEAKSLELYKLNESLSRSNEGHQQRLHILNEFAIAVTELKTIDELGWYVAKEVVGKLGFTDCVFYLFNEGTQRLVQTAAIAEKNPQGHDILNPLEIPLGQGITGNVALSGEAEIIGDVTNDPRYLPDVIPGGSEICVPMIHGDRLLGVIDCEHPDKHHFNENDLEILGTVASYAAAKIAERQARQEVETRANELEEKVKQLTSLKEELETAKDKAEEHSALKSRFVAAISHEIRTPLSGILGSLDLLGDEDLPSRSSALVDMAKTSGQTLHTLLNDVIDFARTEAGTLKLEPSVFSVRELIGSIQYFWHPHMEAKNCTLDICIDDAVKGAYWGDPARIRQIINNYISNALKYSETEKLVLAVTCANSSSEDSNQLRFQLQDFGIGLSIEDQAIIFEEFSQTRTQSRSNVEGTGLGLAICRQLARLMAGEVGVESQLGKGATFWLAADFKVATAAESQPQTEERVLTNFKERLNRRARVLVAEDVPTNQIIVRTELERFGCRVTIANNGIEAVEAARRHSYDIIFMDIAMPSMDGIEATKRIIQMLGKENAPPIYALTAHGMDEDRQDFQSAGMVDLVTKPFNRKQLYYAIENALDLSGDMAEPITENLDQENAIPFFEQERLGSLLETLDEESCGLLIDQSLKDLNKILDGMREGLQNHDPDHVAKMAHQLKSVSGTFGLPRIQHLSEQTQVHWKNELVTETLNTGRTICETLPKGLQMIEDTGKLYR